MKKIRLCLILLITLSFASCAKEGFDLYSVKAVRKISASVDKDGVLLGIKECVALNVRLSDDEIYTYRVSYPDLDLAYEGTIRNGEEAILEITQGAHFASGEYKVVITNEDGSDKDSSFALLSYDLDNLPHYDSSGIYKGSENVVIALENNDGIVSATPDDSIDLSAFSSAIFTYRDKYGNEITLKEELMSPSN